MDASAITGHGKPENTSYDRARHAKMRLRPIAYGHFMVNRILQETPLCEGCKLEIEKPTYFINKRPYHEECFLNAGSKRS